MSIDYTHAQNLHSLDGPCAAVRRIFGNSLPRSVLDIGCGTGTWLKAFHEAGVEDFQGIDGVAVPPEQLVIPKERFRLQDLTAPWNLGREFELALCLEVGEHLSASYAATLVTSITQHAHHVVFSAACPGQSGQHHVNCQPPSYWQALFNRNGFACFDTLREKLWDNATIEPWYRQNMFEARKNDALAGNEPRIRFLIHPAMLSHGLDRLIRESEVRRIEDGSMPILWYFGTAAKAVVSKCRRSVQQSAN